MRDDEFERRLADLLIESVPDPPREASVTTVRELARPRYATATSRLRRARSLRESTPARRPRLAIAGAVLAVVLVVVAAVAITHGTRHLGSATSPSSSFQQPPPTAIRRTPSDVSGGVDQPKIVHIPAQTIASVPASPAPPNSTDGNEAKGCGVDPRRIVTEYLSPSGVDTLCVAVRGSTRLKIFNGMVRVLHGKPRVAHIVGAGLPHVTIQPGARRAVRAADRRLPGSRTAPHQLRPPPEVRHLGQVITRVRGAARRAARRPSPRSARRCPRR